MKKILFLLVLPVLFADFVIAQQENLVKAEQQLVKIANTLLRDSVLENRIAAADQLSNNLRSTLQTSHSFAYPFDTLEQISILYPADSTFRVFTWQIYINPNEYQYGGILQKRTGELFSLTDKSAEIPPYDLEYEVGSPDSWYGAIYYNLKQFDTPEGKKYLLFGFDGFEFFRKRKVVEVLHFGTDGQPVFGAPVFAKTAEGYEATFTNRLIAEYASEVAVTLNYDPEMKLIIKDHLIGMKSPRRGVGNIYVPDGSYEGYELKNGRWEYLEKVFHQVSEHPPAPQPILDKRTQKDLFGKAAKARDKNVPMKQ